MQRETEVARNLRRKAAQMDRSSSAGSGEADNNQNLGNVFGRAMAYLVNPDGFTNEQYRQEGEEAYVNLRNDLYHTPVTGVEVDRRPGCFLWGILGVFKR